MSSLINKIYTLFEENKDSSDAQKIQKNRRDLLEKQFLNTLDADGKKLYIQLSDEETTLGIFSDFEEFARGFKAAVKMIFEALN